MLLQGEVTIKSIDISRYVPDTYMYYPSRIMKSIQYLTETNVIRIWNDKIMNIRPEIESKSECNHAENDSKLMLP